MQAEPEHGTEHGAVGTPPPSFASAPPSPAHQAPQAGLEDGEAGGPAVLRRRGSYGAESESHAGSGRSAQQCIVAGRAADGTQLALDDASKVTTAQQYVMRNLVGRAAKVQAEWDKCGTSSLQKRLLTNSLVPKDVKYAFKVDADSASACITRRVKQRQSHSAQDELATTSLTNIEAIN